MAAESIILSLITATPRWWHPQHGAGTGDLTAMPDQGRWPLTVIVPGSNVLISQVSLPSGSRQRLIQALPFTLEDQLVQDVDYYHCVLGQPVADTPGTWVAAAVARDTMTDWTGQLAEAGLTPDVLLPAPLVLPAPDDTQQANVLVMGDSVLVRTGAGQAFEAGLHDAAVLLSMSTELTTLNVADPDQRWSGVDQSGWQVRAWTFGEWPADFLKPQINARLNAKAELNLLQGPWQGRGDTRARVAGVWRWATVAAAAAGLLALLSLFLDVRSLKARHQVLDRETLSVAAVALPDIQPGADYRGQLTQMLARLQGISGGRENSFFYLLEVVGPALVAGAGAQLQSIEFRTGGVELDLTAGSLDQVENLRRQISDTSPLPVSIDSSETVVDGTRVRMRVGGNDQ